MSLRDVCRRFGVMVMESALPGSRRTMTDHMTDEDLGVCDRCGDEYEHYLVFVKDNFSDILQFHDCEYDHLCKPCRAFLFPDGQYFLHEGEEIIPKTEEMLSHE